MSLPRSFYLFEKRKEYLTTALTARKSAQGERKTPAGQSMTQPLEKRYGKSPDFNAEAALA